MRKKLVKMISVATNQEGVEEEERKVIKQSLTRRSRLRLRGLRLLLRDLGL